jgi:hypothetical protein
MRSGSRVRSLVAVAVVAGAIGAVALWPGRGQAQQNIAGEKVWLRPLVLILRPATASEQRAVSAQLGLNESQKRQLHQANVDFERSAQTLKARHEDLLRRLSKLMTSDTSVQTESVKQTCQQIEQTESELIDKEIAYYDQVRTTLEPGQRRKFWDLFEKARLGPALPPGGPGTGTGRGRQQ